MKIINKTLWTIIVSFCIFAVLASLQLSKANNEDNNKSSSTAPAKHTDLSKEQILRQKYLELRKPRMSHGPAKEGLAAFLICERKQFKIGEPIPVMFGIVYGGSEMHMTFQPPSGPDSRGGLSWFSITGPDGKDVPFTADFDVLGPGPEAKQAIWLTARRFCGIVKNDVRWGYKFDTLGSYTIKWHYRIPTTSDGSWWQGHIVSNEIQIEIVK